MYIMKYMNHIKLGLLAVTFACAGTVFTSCEDDITINAVNTEKLDTVYTVMSDQLPEHANLLQFLSLGIKPVRDIFILN